MEPHLHGGHGDPETERGLFGARPVDLAQHEDEAVQFGELVHAKPQVHPNLVAEGGGLGLRAGAGEKVRRGRLEGPVTVAFLDAPRSGNGCGRSRWRMIASKLRIDRNARSHVSRRRLPPGVVEEDGSGEGKSRWL
jgi:hypothetical protein